MSALPAKFYNYEFADGREKPSRGVHVVFNRVKAYQGNFKASAKSNNWPLTCSKVAARMLAFSNGTLPSGHTTI